MVGGEIHQRRRENRRSGRTRLRRRRKARRSARHATAGDGEAVTKMHCAIGADTKAIGAAAPSICAATAAGSTKMLAPMVELTMLAVSAGITDRADELRIGILRCNGDRGFARHSMPIAKCARTCLTSPHARKSSRRLLSIPPVPECFDRRGLHAKMSLNARIGWWKN